MDNVRLHGIIKGVIALVLAILAALTTAFATGATDVGDIDTQTWLIALGTVLASGALVAFVENIPGVAGGIMKAVIGAFGAFIAALVPAFDDRIVSQLELITALSAFVAALALVYEIPEPTPEPVPEPAPPTTVARAPR
jgi:hypothetical protein